MTFADTGDYGKPRPAVVIQTDLLPETESVLLCLIGSAEEEIPFCRRIAVEPSAANGLRKPSQIMADKILAVRRRRCRKVIGRLEADTLERLNESLALVIGLLD